MLVGSHGKILTDKCNAPLRGHWRGLGHSLGISRPAPPVQLNTWEMPREERGLEQGILHIKSLIINIKAVSGTEQPHTTRTPTPRNGNTSLSSAWISSGKKSTWSLKTRMMPHRGWHTDSCLGWKIQSLGRTQPASSLWGSRMQPRLSRYLGQLQDFPLAFPTPWSLNLLGFPYPGAYFLHSPLGSSAGFCLSPPSCLPARCHWGQSGSRCIYREYCHCCSGTWGTVELGLHSSCAALWFLHDMQDKCLELATELWEILDLQSSHLIGRRKI